MAIDPTQLALIQTGQSIATPTPQTQAIFTGTTVYNPLLIEQQVNQYIEGNQHVDALTFPIDLGANTPFVTIQIGTYSRSGTQSVGAIDYNRRIRLPIPNSLVDHHQVAYEQKELGAVVGAAASAAGFKGQVNGAQSPFQQSTTAQSAGGVAGAIAGGAASAAGLDGVGGALSSLTGLSINDYLTILFKGPTYKKYQFEWKLVARNQKESDIIHTIINTLNNAMAPSLAVGALIFGYPDIFFTSFSDKIRDRMYEFKPAVLEDLQVNYLGSGTPSFYKDGSPESVIIHLSFMEVEFWLKGQFGQRYSPVTIPAPQTTTPNTSPTTPGGTSGLPAAPNGYTYRVDPITGAVTLVPIAPTR